MFSLWNTFTAVHRVVPSLVFLAGNAAIFGAGFYTLFRWRLRETSRATLIIGLLLVPLSILTGISISGVDQTAVPLDDPITLITLLVAGSVYVTLVWHAAKALVGTRLAVPLVTGMSVAIATAPLMPAASRMFGETSVFLLGIGSLATWFSCRRIEMLLRRPSATHAQRVSLVLGVLATVFAIVTGYVAYTVVKGNIAQIMRLGAIVFPAMIQLAITTESTGARNRRSKMTTVGTGSIIFAVALGLLASIPALASVTWFSTWAATMAIGGILLSRSVRNGWFGRLMVIVPAALWMVACSSVLTLDLPWNQLAIWQRFYGGGPMLVFGMLGVIGTALVISGRLGNRAALAAVLTGTAWSVAGVQAFAMAIIAPTQLGWMPDSLRIAVLGAAGANLIGIAAKRAIWPQSTAENASSVERRFALCPTLMTGLGHLLLLGFWMGLFQPTLVWSPIGVLSWMKVLLATAWTGILLSELTVRSSQVHSLCRSASSFLLTSSFSLAVISSAAFGPSQPWPLIAVMFATTLGWYWLGTLGSFSSRLFAKSAFAISLIAASLLLFHTQLVSEQSLRLGTAFWYWSLVSWMLVAWNRFQIWIGEYSNRRQHENAGWRRLAALNHSVAVGAENSNRMQHIKLLEQVFDKCSLQLATAVSCVACGFGFLATLIGWNWIPFVNAPSTCATVTVLFVGLLAVRRNPKFTHVMHLASAMFACSVLSGVLVQDPIWRLVLCTSLVLVANELIRKLAIESTTSLGSRIRFQGFVLGLSHMALGAVRDKKPERAPIGSEARTSSSPVDNAPGPLSRIATSLSVTVVSFASTSLIVRQWWPSVEQGLSPPVAVAACIALWWLFGFMSLVIVGLKKPDETILSIAMLLAGLTTTLLAPIAYPSQPVNWLLWVVITWGLLSFLFRQCFEVQLRWSEGLSIATAAAVAIGALFHVCFDVVPMIDLTGFPAVALTCVALLVVGRCRDSLLGLETAISVPAIITCMAAAQLSLLIDPWISLAPTETLRCLWLLIATRMLVGSPRRLDHAAALSVSLVVVLWSAFSPGLALASPSLWLGLAGSSVAAFSPMSGCLAKKKTSGGSAGYLMRGGSLIGISCGMYFLAWVSASPMQWDLTTLLLGWLATWTFLYRLGIWGSLPQNWMPDLETTAMACVIVAGELAMAVLGWTENPTSQTNVALLAWTIVTLLLVPGSPRRIDVMFSSVLLSVSSAVLSVAMHFQFLDSYSRLTIVLTTCSFCMGVLVYFRHPLGLAKHLQPTDDEGVTFALYRIATFVALGVGLGATYLIGTVPGHMATPIALSALAMVAIAFAELGSQPVLRHALYVAVWMGLYCVGLACCLNQTAVRPDTWTLLSRWFVAWVVTSVSLGFLPARLLSPSRYEEWRKPIRSGIAGATLLSTICLVSLLGVEISIRMEGTADLLNRTLVMGVAATLACITLLTTIAALLSAPGRGMQQKWQVPDRYRVGLIVAAQIAGGLTWFHLFLCESPLASLGLRAYWPYVVMSLAFASVGIGEWARKSQDAVLYRTIRQSAFLLPIIPVLGFWLSGSLVSDLFGHSTARPWSFIEGRVSYQALLVVATIYYGAISLIWKGNASRVISIVLGNGLIWVLLAQTPGWSFVLHPQAWLIPAALSALLATHLHGDVLGKTWVATARYVCTLLIYLSSTADMLVQGIGNTIAGPIVLILIAMVGIAVGIAIRIPGFVYLGSFFVFTGLTSMVWHAQTRIGAVWPWWVFGISMGVALLAGLTLLEKNRPKLRRMLETNP
ncbi:MAG: hypothetical protein AAFV88_20405 [Planctomycetota bacterium]